MDWKYIKPLKDENSVRKLAVDMGIELPVKLLRCLEANNGGRPASKSFDTKKNKGYVFNSLFSFNEGDANSFARGADDMFGEGGLFPVGIEASGDIIAYETKTDKLVLINQDVARLDEIDVSSNEGLFADLV